MMSATASARWASAVSPYSHMATVLTKRSMRDLTEVTRLSPQRYGTSGPFVRYWVRTCRSLLRPQPSAALCRRDKLCKTRATGSWVYWQTPAIWLHSAWPAACRCTPRPAEGAIRDGGRKLHGFYG